MMKQLFQKQIKNLVVLGGGSAGLIVAITLKKKLPHLAVRVVRSPEIGIIGVGEGTTVEFGEHFFQYLGFNPKQFYAEAQPIWKLGIRFLWGQRQSFNYTFSRDYDQHFPELKRNPGFYYSTESPAMGICSACMDAEKVFPRMPNGAPDLSMPHGYHVENIKLVSWLEKTAIAVGVDVTEGRMTEAERDGMEIKSLLLESGERVEADLFVDASGFRSELLSRVLEEPFVSFDESLFCDRAVIGGWPRRENEPIKTYTTAETMNAGWCWQIDHEKWINRGYVYSSKFISDEDAQAELLEKNPAISNQPRIVKFRSGHTERSWIGNVVGVGNANGFVEPLEATALHIICVQSRRLAQTLLESDYQPTPTMVQVFNELNDRSWDDIRDFLAIHYKYNTLLDTPFWRHCREHTDVGGAGRIVEFFEENGPTSMTMGYYTDESSQFGINGYLAMLVGQNVAHQKPYDMPEQEKKLWSRHQQTLKGHAAKAYTAEQALEIVRSPRWKWGA